MAEEKIIFWDGMSGVEEPSRLPSSMHIVDYYNVKALRELGWNVRMGKNRRLPNIGFWHQTWAPFGSPSFHYCCTSSTATMPRAGLAEERKHAAIFVLNSLMLDNFRKMGLNAHYWPHGVDPEIAEKLEGVKKFPDFTIINIAQGQFSPEKSIKGITWLVDAVLSIPDLNLIQIGACWEDDVILPLRDGPRRLGDLSNGIRFIKDLLPYEETQELLAKSHMYVNTSVGEGCPLPPLEAMNLGVPVLTTDLPFAHDWPFSEVVRRIPSEPFVDTSYLHDQIFSPRDLNAYDIPPVLFRPHNVRERLLGAIVGYADWQRTCKEYAEYLHEKASWKANLVNCCIPIIGEFIK